MRSSLIARHAQLVLNYYFLSFIFWIGLQKKTTMNSNKFTSPHAVWVTTAFFMLSFYGLGAGMMDSFVVYHTWRFIGDAEFSQAHIASGSRIVPVFVLPLLVMTIFLVLMFWHRPRVISREMLWASLVCAIISWLSSAFIQIPMQAQLSQGKDVALLNELIYTDWIRIIPHWIMMVIVAMMIKMTISQKEVVKQFKRQAVPS